MRQRNQTPPAEPQDPANSLFLVKRAVLLGKGNPYKEKKLVSKFPTVVLLIAAGRRSQGLILQAQMC